MSYVYTHTRIDTGKVFYVGIGSDKTYKRSRNTFDRNKHWKNITNKTGYYITITHDELPWNTVCIEEIKLIAHYGRKDKGLGSLCNLTDGGDGVLGRKKITITDKLRNAISAIHLGKITSSETKELMRKSHMGKCYGGDLILNTITGIFYDSVKDAAKSANIGYSKLRHNLIYSPINRTNFIYA